MKPYAMLLTLIFFFLMVRDNWRQAVLVLILCIPVYMFLAVLLPLGGRAPKSTPRQGGDQSANSGETKL